MPRIRCPFGAGLDRSLQSRSHVTVLGLSDYGRYAFGSDRHPMGIPVASPVTGIERTRL